MSDAFWRVATWVAESAPALLVGSVALRALHGETQRPNDVDFLVPVSSLTPIVRALRGYRWKSWEREVEAPFDEEALAGRIYLRGKHSALPTLDLTYEPPLRWSDAWSRRRAFAGVQVASPQDLATIMEARGTERDLEWAQKLRGSSLGHGT